MIVEDETHRRLAVLDVEGVILPKRRYLLLQATKRLDFVQILKIMALGLLYEVGLTTLETSLKRIYRLFEGTPIEEIRRTFETIPLIPETLHVVSKLKGDGYQIALISSGIPHFLVEALAERVGADYAFGLHLEIVDNTFTGRISGEVLEPKGKATILTRILAEGRYSQRHCIVIADDRNNLPMFDLCATTIGYNPDTFVSAKCDYAIKGDLRDVLPPLETHGAARKTSYTRRDTFREVIHMGSFLIAVLCRFFDVDKSTIAAIIFVTIIAYAFSELARRAGTSVPLFTSITRSAAIGEEKWGFATSPIFFALGILLSLFVFPPHIGFAAITILTLGDGSARVVGKNWGRRVLPYNKAKTIEGIAASIAMATLASLLFVKPLEALVASTISMVVESLPLPIDDNIVIPLLAGVILTILAS